MSIYGFVWLCNRSFTAFWELQKGSCPEQAADNRKQFQKDIASYAKAARLQGKIDETLRRAMAHIAEMDRTLWKEFAKRMCKREGKKCHIHGKHELCRKAFESWLGRRSY